MDASLAGIIGALIGSVSAIAATYLASAHTSRTEAKRWKLSKKDEAYSESIRALLKVMNYRSAITNEGRLILDSERFGDWLNYCIDAIYWTKRITIYSHRLYVAEGLRNALAQFEEVVLNLATGHGRLMTEGLVSEPAVVVSHGGTTGITFVHARAESLLHEVEAAARGEMLQ